VNSITPGGLSSHEVCIETSTVGIPQREKKEELNTSLFSKKKDPLGFFVL